MSVRRRFGFDMPLLAVTVILVVIGIFFVFSSSGFMAREKYNQTFHFMIQQVLGAVAGLGPARPSSSRSRSPSSSSRLSSTGSSA